MVDVETLDVGRRSVVLSIGATLFDPRPRPLDRPMNPTVGGGVLHLFPDIDHQILMGRTVSWSTVRFWMGEETGAARGRMVSEPRTPVHECLIQLAAHLARAELIWCCPPQFDASILESLCEDMLWKEPPWKHWQLRDVRTLREEMGLTSWEHPAMGDERHDAVADCVRQSMVVVEARSRLAGMGLAPTK